MRVKRKQIGIVLVLVGLIIFISPNFLALVGGFNQVYRFDICSKCFGEPKQLNLIGESNQAIDKLNITLGFSAVTQSMYGQGNLITSIMRVYADDRYIGSINLINLNDRGLVTGDDITLWNGKTNSYIFQLNGEKRVNISFVFQESGDSMGAKLFIKSVEYTTSQTGIPPVIPPWINLPISTESGFNIIGLVFIVIGGVMVVRKR